MRRFAVQPQDIAAFAQKIRKIIVRVGVGKNEMIDLLLPAVIARGHVLMEDVPGTGKTVTARSFARSVGGQFSRIQFTPDLLPSDITGTRVYRQDEGRFVFHPGPVFTNILLADEINRATPRTQSALLECMEERQVTDGGVTYALPDPFLVIATQNPVEIQGTFPLPAHGPLAPAETPAGSLSAAPDPRIPGSCRGPRHPRPVPEGGAAGAPRACV